jgi:hypothetical protein
VLLKTTDVRNSVLPTESDSYYRISPEIAERMEKTSLHEQDILINIVGATTDVIGRVAFVPKGFPKANITQAMSLIRIADKSYEPATVFAFLSGKFGQLQVRKLARPTGQYNLNLGEVASFSLPQFSPAFNTSIRRLVDEAHSCISLIWQNLQNTEKVLLAALGLGNWQPPEPLTYTRRASDVSSVGRFDAEHFQPKYDAAVAEAKKRGAIIVSLQEIVCPLIAGIDSRDFVENGAPYIRVGDVKGGRIAKESAEKVPVAVAETGKDIQLRPGDVVYTRKGSFGNAAIVRSGDEVCVISTEIIRLRITDEWKSKLLPEYFAAYINSRLGRWQSEKWAHGAAFYSVSQDDLLKFVVLIPPFAEQLKIKGSIDKSEAARQRAQELLAAAQRAVEIAIEESEAAALVYLKTHGV